MENTKKSKSGSRISIFISILFPLLFSLVLIHLLLAYGLRPHFNPKGFPDRPPRLEELPGEVRSHLESLIHRIESSQVDQLAALAFDNDVEIVYQRGSLNWKSNLRLPSWNELAGTSGDSGPLRRFHHSLFYRIEKGDLRVAVFLPPGSLRRMPPPPRLWFMIAVQVGIILLLCYGLLAWQLQPLRSLSQGVEEVARGNLAHRLPVKGSREFSRLSEGFNEMAQTLSRMMLAKEELVLGVSHELRSPLASMKVAVELLDDERRKRQLRSYILQMESMVNELLESYRLGNTFSAVSPEDLSIAEVFQEIEQYYSDSGAALKFTNEAAGLPLHADRRAILRLFSNLIDNAIKYSGKESEIEISAQKVEGGIEFRVSDAGPGIPEPDLFHVFEPFYRVDKSRDKETGGFGLGLYLCRKIVESHQGSITASNRPGGGCMLTVRFPLELRRVG